MIPGPKRAGVRVGEAGASAGLVAGLGAAGGIFAAGMGDGPDEADWDLLVHTIILLRTMSKEWQTMDWRKEILRGRRAAGKDGAGYVDYCIT
jgi:hypothetical protein